MLKKKIVIERKKGKFLRKEINNYRDKDKNGKRT